MPFSRAGIHSPASPQSAQSCTSGGMDKKRIVRRVADDSNATQFQKKRGYFEVIQTSFENSCSFVSAARASPSFAKRTRTR